MHCDMCFSELSNCKRHERIHTEKPHQCKHCNRCFSELEALKKHERAHTAKKPYKCEHCDKCFSRPSQLKRHEPSHTGSITDQASKSAEATQPFSSFADHSTDQLNTFSCWMWLEELTSQALLMEHYENHMRQIEFIIFPCSYGKMFTESVWHQPCHPGKKNRSGLGQLV